MHPITFERSMTKSGIQKAFHIDLKYFYTILRFHVENTSADIACVRSFKSVAAACIY